MNGLEKFILRKRGGARFACGIRYRGKEFMVGGPRSFIPEMTRVAGIFGVDCGCGEGWNISSGSRAVLVAGMEPYRWYKGLELLWGEGFTQERVHSFRRLLR